MSENWFKKLFIDEAKPALDHHKGGGSSATVAPITITKNGTYDITATGLPLGEVLTLRSDITESEILALGYDVNNNPDILLIACYPDGPNGLVGDMVYIQPCELNDIAVPALWCRKGAANTGSVSYVHLTQEALETLGVAESGAPVGWYDYSDMSTADAPSITLAEGDEVTDGAITFFEGVSGATDAIGYNPVIVNVPVPDGYVKPEGTVNITTNGPHDVSGKATASVAVYGEVDTRLSQLIDGTLTEVYDEKVTKVREYAFSRLASLTRIDLPNVTEAGDNAFSNTALKDINLPKLTKIGNEAFRYCGAEEINFPLLTSSGSNAFAYNPNLTKAHLPLLKEGTYGLFYNCSRLTDVYMPLASLGSGTFQGCSALVEALYPQSTEAISNTFKDCTSLERVDIGAPSSVHTTKGIGYAAFSQCSSLKLLIIRSTNRTPLEYSSAFSGTPFASDGTGGTAYVARTTLYTYETSTNWSALYAAGTCTFKALEDYTVDGTITGEMDWDKVENGVLETATIPAGTYTAPETLDVTALTNIAGDYPMSFVCEGTSHRYFRVTTGRYIYYDSVYGGRLIYTSGPEWNKPTITLETDQEVNPKFAEWFTSNYILQTT